MLSNVKGAPYSIKPIDNCHPAVRFLVNAHITASKPSAHLYLEKKPHVNIINLYFMFQRIYAQFESCWETLAPKITYQTKPFVTFTRQRDCARFHKLGGFL